MLAKIFYMMKRLRFVLLLLLAGMAGFAFAGTSDPDNPKPLENVKAVLSEDYQHVILTWSPASEEGESGGYVDTSKVTYYVFDAFGSIYDPAIAVTRDTAIVLEVADTGRQDFVAYQVTAGIDETWYSLASNSNILATGQPDPLPFMESFAGKSYRHAWVADPATTFSGVLTKVVGDNELPRTEETAEDAYINPQDEDNGFFMILPVEKDAVFGMQSVKVDISSASDPVIDFYYQGSGGILDVMVEKDGGGFRIIKSLTLKDTPATGWTLCRTSLADCLPSRYIRAELRLRASDNDKDNVWMVCIDNLHIHNLASNDLRIASVKTPQEVDAGENITIKTHIENLGTQPVQGARLELSCNDQSHAVCQIPPLDAEETYSASFSIPTSAASPDSIICLLTLVSEGDEVTANDTCATTVRILFSDLPAVDSLTAISANGEVCLTWAAPDLEPMKAPFIRKEDFEDSSYPALTISDFGGWTLYDGDGKKTYTFLRDTDNPHRTEPMAFQLFDPRAAGVPTEQLIDCRPHSGRRMLMAWSCQGKNDNWLISPLLSGHSQTVSFYAKSFTAAWPEEFEVLCSSAGKSISDFVRVDSIAGYPKNGMVSEEWTEYTFPVPAGTKYFAIRHIANDTYSLMVDDITFESAGALPDSTSVTGYNIYRNGEKLNTTPITALSYTDNSFPAGLCSYRVSVVYNTGESRASAPAAIMVPSGVGSVEPSGWSVTLRNSALCVTGAHGCTVLVRDLSGRTLHASVAEDETIIPLQRGFYIVTIGRSSAKLVVP